MSPRELVKLWLVFVQAVLSSLPLVQAQLTPGSTRSRGSERIDVEFKHVHPGVSAPEAVFVIGDLPELGAGDMTRAIQLVSVDGATWTVRISLPVDRGYSFQFALRDAGIQALQDPANGVAITALERGRTLRTLAGPGTKTFQLHTDLSSPLVHWRQDAGAFAIEALEHLGAGRSDSEQRYGIRSLGLGKRSVEFFLTSSDGSVRDPVDPTTTYQTALDEFFLQDGELFSYVPAPSVSPMRRDYVTPFTIQSSVLGVERHFRVMLPRGYHEHATRRYPVLYHYDGQHLWDERAGQFGIWDEDGARMASLVRGGVVGELIQVGIDYIPDELCFNQNRARDCLSPEDISEDFFCPTVRGEADRFLAFLIEELKPLIDATYRTLPGRPHTFATGYSYGGVFALYAGWEFPDVFGAVAPQSGSFWVPNFTARVLVEPRRDVRIYLDTGTREPSISGPAGTLRESFLARLPGYVLSGDLGYHVGFNQPHGFVNGGRRMRAMMTFLWPATREAASVPWP